MNKNKKKPITYYISGALVLTIGIISLIISITLPLLDSSKSYLGYIGVALTFISLVILIYSLYLLKKATFLKKMLLKEDKDKLINQIEDTIKSKEKELDDLNKDK